MGVMSAVVPFLAIYLIWVIFFAIMAYILGANESNADSYTGVNPLLGYFFTTFENSIGNINAPSIKFLKDKKDRTFLDNFCIYLIYIFWWLAQIVLLVVLLNFVIALIS